MSISGSQGWGRTDLKCFIVKMKNSVEGFTSIVTTAEDISEMEDEQHNTFFQQTKLQNSLKVNEKKLE